MVSDFEHIDRIATNGSQTTQRIFTSRNNINHTSYALTESVAILNALENFVQIPFALSSLDQAVVPETRVGGLNLNVYYS